MLGAHIHRPSSHQYQWISNFSHQYMADTVQHDSHRKHRRIECKNVCRCAHRLCRNYRDGIVSSSVTWCDDDDDETYFAERRNGKTDRLLRYERGCVRFFTNACLCIGENKRKKLVVSIFIRGETKRSRGSKKETNGYNAWLILFQYIKCIYILF